MLNKDLWGKINLGFEHFIDKLIETYGKILTWVLGHKRYVIIGVVLLFVGAGSLGGSGFRKISAGSGDRGEFNLIVELEPQATRDKPTK